VHTSTGYRADGAGCADGYEMRWSGRSGRGRECVGDGDEEG